ncbi:MAG: hypothetical protein AAGG81_00240, partial [Chlamydiota bacterium]
LDTSRYITDETTLQNPAKNFESLMIGKEGVVATGLCGEIKLSSGKTIKVDHFYLAYDNHQKIKKIMDQLISENKSSFIAENLYSYKLPEKNMIPDEVLLKLVRWKF